MKATSRTGILGVIGWPIKHSRSPAMQNAALESLGADLVYLAFAVPDGKLPMAIAGARSLGVRGLNVTVPHKQSVMALCQPDELARKVGAVNTLSFDGDVVRGSNTDVHGFRMMLDEAGGMTPGRVVILGAGGAAHAIVAALEGLATHITSVSRSGHRVPGAEHAAWPTNAADTRALLDGASLLVDATPRGLADDAAAFDVAALPPHALVLDLVVKRETPIVRAARARGLRASNGAAMLLHQGAASLERWLGRPAPLEVMRAALDASLE
ncbi:MAG TPA: shikimate dehydrogenase [Polyangia bacterium]|nr:shikimate dehydrogenase [Polyangia bacterium]